MTAQTTAVLGNKGEFSSFSYGGTTIRFRTSRHLERYMKIKTWDDGYLEVMANYDNAPDEEEEYIDLIPILKNLYMNPQHFYGISRRCGFIMDNWAEIADRADMIVNGYAFTKEGNVVRVLHLDSPYNAAVLSDDGSVLETNMDDIELALIAKYYARNRKFRHEIPEETAYA